MNQPAKAVRSSSRAAILRIFAESVAERGYSETSISSVADVLGISKGTIVHHFGTKENLLAEVHTAYFERRFAEADHILASLSAPPAQLTAIIYALVSAHRDDRAASLTFLREFVRYAEGTLTEHVRERRRDYTELVRDVIERGVHRGDFRTPDASLTALQVFGMCNYAWTWYRVDGPKTSEMIAREFARTLLGGLWAQDASTSVLEFDQMADKAIAVVQEAPGRLPPEALGRGAGTAAEG